MAEERISRSPAASVAVGEENREPEKKEVVKDRKSLTGMSEKVKATLAPLLGGIKHHPEVEVDLGRESGAVAYETVPMGSTPMSRYSTVAESESQPPWPAAADAADSDSDSSVVDKVKDAVTGQAPGRGIYSGKGTSDGNPKHSDRLPTAVRDHIPVQDVGLGRSKQGSSVAGHKPNEDKYVLDGSTDPVHRYGSTTPTENPFNG